MHGVIAMWTRPLHETLLGALQDPCSTERVSLERTTLSPVDRANAARLRRDVEVVAARELWLTAGELRQRFERLRLNGQARVQVDGAIIDAWCSIDPPLSSISDDADLESTHRISLVERPRSTPARQGRSS